MSSNLINLSVNQCKFPGSKDWFVWKLATCTVLGKKYHFPDSIGHMFCVPQFQTHPNIIAVVIMHIYIHAYVYVYVCARYNMLYIYISLYIHIHTYVVIVVIVYSSWFTPNFVALGHQDHQTGSKKVTSHSSGRPAVPDFWGTVERSGLGIFRAKLRSPQHLS